MRYLSASCAVMLCALAGGNAMGQQAPADELPPPPAPVPGEPPPADATQAPAEAPAEAACVPACREGYLCHEGSCIAACNPPCAAGERCTSAGACVLDHPPPPAFAPPANEPWVTEDSTAPGVEAHDGFMLRLVLGFGGGALTVQGGGFPEEEYSGGGGTFSLDLGGSLTENLVLHGRLVEYFIFDPTLSVDGMELGDTTDVTMGSVMFGVGVTYYFMPINLYLTGVIGPSRVTVDVNGEDRGQSEYGFGLNVDVGKEWWVGDQWGLGVALRVWYSTVTESDSGVDVTLDFTAAALMFSATYQ